MTPLPTKLVEIAERFSCRLTRCEYCDRNQGAAAGNELFLGEFDDPDIEIVAFFHELGHFVSGHRLDVTHWLCTVTREAVAWEVGFQLAREYGHDWDYDSKQRTYARQCLSSYNAPENYR